MQEYRRNPQAGECRTWLLAQLYAVEQYIVVFNTQIIHMISIELLCFAVCMTLLASFFLPSASVINIYMYMYMYMYIACTCFNEQ